MNKYLISNLVNNKQSQLEEITKTACVRLSTLHRSDLTTMVQANIDTQLAVSLRELYKASSKSINNR